MPHDINIRAHKVETSLFSNDEISIYSYNDFIPSGNLSIPIPLY